MFAGKYNIFFSPIYPSSPKFRTPKNQEFRKILLFSMTGLLLKIRNPSIFYDQPSPENQEFRIFHEILERDEEKKLYFLGNFRAFPLIFSKWILKIILKLHLTLQYVSTDEFRLSKTLSWSSFFQKSYRKDHDFLENTKFPHQLGVIL